MAMTRLAYYLKNVPDNAQTSAGIAYLANLDHIAQASPLVADAIENEIRCQRSTLKLKPSENYSSLSVQLAMGNLLTDRYSERFIAGKPQLGTDNVHAIESLVIKKLQKLFKIENAYAYPHSGTDANMVAYWAILVHRIQNTEIERLGLKSSYYLDPQQHEKIRQQMVNQTIMGMSLNAGGHITHGSIHHMSSKMMRSVSYNVHPESQGIDYMALLKMAREQKPAILLAGYSAFSQRLNFAKLRSIADDVGAVLMVDMAHFSAFVATGLFKGDQNPVPFADVLTSTTHKTLRGPRGGFILCQNEYADVFSKGCPLVLSGPIPNMLAAKAVALEEADTEDFKRYTQKVLDNAQVLVDELLRQGIHIVSGGTQNHLFIIDLTPFNLTGRQAENAFAQVNIKLNRDPIPYDPLGPAFNSGIRLGTPALTTLGMSKDEMIRIAQLIVILLNNIKPICNENGSISRTDTIVPRKIKEHIKDQVRELMHDFPLYPEIVLPS